MPIGCQPAQAMRALISAPIVVLGCLLSLGIQAVQAQSLRYLGRQVLPHAFEYAGTTVGGLSGLEFDAARGHFVALSDDRSERDPARFYTLELNLAAFNTRPEPGHAGVRFVGMTTLKTGAGAPFPKGSVDPEAIRYSAQAGTLLWASEGDARKGIAPAITGMDVNGRTQRQFSVPAHYLPARGSGVRYNLAFESLAVDAAAGRLYVGTENALVQDGPEADTDGGSPCRILVYDERTGELLAEHVAVTDPVPVAPPLPLLYRTNGLVELLAGEGILLALERAYVQGVGSFAKIYRLDFAGASNVAGRPALAGGGYLPARKTLVLDLNDLGIELDNLEGMSWGPRLANGHRTMVLVADDNFSRQQVTQFLAFELVE